MVTQKNPSEISSSSSSSEYGTDALSTGLSDSRYLSICCRELYRTTLQWPLRVSVVQPCNSHHHLFSTCGTHLKLVAWLVGLHLAKQGWSMMWLVIWASVLFCCKNFANFSVTFVQPGVETVWSNTRRSPRPNFRRRVHEDYWTRHSEWQPLAGAPV